MLSQLEQSILSTLVYFGMFDYPLTLLEVHRYLFNGQYTLAEVRQALEASEPLQKVVRSKNGYFYLRGRENVLRTRAERFTVAIPKHRRARRIARPFSFLPFIRLIAVCNSLSYHNARSGSDIDLFIVTKRGGVWWARLFSLAILKMLRLRPGQNGVKDKICLSFFVDEEHLDLSRLRIGDSDIYLTYWLATLYPLYDAGGYYERLCQTNQTLAMIPHPRRSLPGRMTGWNRRPLVRMVFEWLLAPLTFSVRGLQLAIMPSSVRRLAGLDTRVRLEDGLLKFHTNDRRLEYSEEFSRRLEAISSGPENLWI